MDTGVQTAFQEMLDISTDIQKALLFTPESILASNIEPEMQTAALAQAQELIRQGELKSAEAGRQPVTQLVIETPAGLVLLVKEAEAEGMVVLATGKKNSRIGLALYDLKSCIRDARTAMNPAAPSPSEGEEA